MWSGSDVKRGIELPAPTAHPLYFALGLSLIIAGLVTHPIVSWVGALAAFAGALGWWREVLPHENEVLSPLQSESERAQPILPRPDAVEHLVAGQGQHRLRLPVEVRPLSAGLRGGLAGAVAMAIVACAYGLIVHGSIWLPINLLAGAALPGMEHETAAQIGRFDTTAFVVACFAHLSISLMMGLVYAALLPMLPGRPLVWGGIVAPLAWTGVTGSAIGLLNPALEQHVSWPWFIASQIAFGLVAGLVVARVEPIRTLQSLSLAERAGVEAGRIASPREEPE
jgi:hypothetical protein